MQCAANPKAKVLDVVAHLIETADRKFKALFAPPPRERTPGAPQRPPPCRAAAPVVCRRRRSARLAARPVSAARGGPVRVAPAGGRGGCPGAAPCAGVAWTAGALVRGSGRHCAGRETAPARAWCKCWWCAGGVRCRKVATLQQAPSGSGAQGREKRAALSSVALSPRGVSRCRASAKTRSPYAAVSALSPTCQRSVVGGWVATPVIWHAELPFRLCGAASPLLKRVRGSAPNNPGRRSPSRVGVGGEV